MPKYNIPEEKVIRTLNLKEQDGSYISYPLGARGQNILLKEGIDLEKKLDNLIIEIEKGYLLVPITVKQADWVQQDGYFTQTVESEDISDRNALLVNMMAKSATAEQQRDYINNFAILAHGYIETGEGEVVFKAYSKPTMDIDVGIVLGNVPVPQEMPLWTMSDDQNHLVPQNKKVIVQGAGEPKDGKDLVTIEYLKKNIFKLKENDTMLFSFINSGYHSPLNPNVLTLVSEFFDVDESGKKLIVKNNS